MLVLAFPNILFEDTVQAVLFQRGVEVKRVPVRDSNKLDHIISSFFSFKSDRVYEFEDAIEKFWRYTVNECPSW